MAPYLSLEDYYPTKEATSPRSIGHYIGGDGGTYQFTWPPKPVRQHTLEVPEAKMEVVTNC